MKSILFVLLMRLNGDVHPLAVFENIEQCRESVKTYIGNVAAAYSCQPADVRGTLAIKR